MKQRDAVIEVMRINKGYATLAHLYKNALNIPGIAWGTKTPFKSINRIVQDRRFFFKIKPGLWALNESRDNLPPEIQSSPKPESDHSYYQGMLVELGNLRGLQTYVPRQDRSRKYLGRKLGDLATLEHIYPFTYESIVRRAATADVVWFNNARLPVEIIEVENTTDMNGALLKFTALDAFHAVFRIVAPPIRQREFQDKVSQTAFTCIRDRVTFSSYEHVSQLHAKAAEYLILDKSWGSV